MNKIMIVEDDRKLNDGIVLALRENCNAFLQCRTLAEARNLLTQEEIALVLLDVNLPDGNGIDFVREVRAYSPVPILLITVNNMELDIVTGLEAGANDYITKPFSLMVLRARVAVWLRAGSVQPNQFSMGPFDFDFRKMEFRREGRLVELSRTEQRLLRVLCENQGATVKRSMLIDSVWQGDGEYVDEHALTVTIKRLRDKLEKDCANPDYIRTVYGIGYTWAVDL